MRRPNAMLVRKARTNVVAVQAEHERLTATVRGHLDTDAMGAACAATPETCVAVLSEIVGRESKIAQLEQGLPMIGI